MSIGINRMIRCKKISCRYKFTVVIGDTFPQEIVCPKCGHKWIIMRP